MPRALKVRFTIHGINDFAEVIHAAKLARTVVLRLENTPEGKLLARVQPAGLPIEAVGIILIELHHQAVRRFPDDREKTLEAPPLNQKLASLSPEVAAYMSVATHWYQVDVDLDRRANPKACGVAIQQAFAADCFVQKAPLPEVKINDLTDRTKGTFVYHPKDYVMFETREEDDISVMGVTKWQKFTIRIDGVEIGESYLLDSNCTYQ